MPDKRDQTALQPGVLRKRKGEFDQDKVCLYDRVIPFGEIATLLKAREDQGNGKT